AVLWTKGAIRDLGVLPGGKGSNAEAINANGQVVGAADTGKSYSHAFLYSENKMRDLGTLGGENSYAWAINARGDVIGHAQTKSGQWDAFLWQQDQMRDLDVLDTGESEAFGINAAGQIVGRSGDLSSNPKGKDKAFLWENGTMVDLNRLIPAHSGWQ